MNKNKIASITFFDPRTNIGGATIPADAFTDWCKQHFGIKCDTIYYKWHSPEFLNDHYDFIFFNTPPRFKNQFDYQNIKIPFALMIHDETDEIKYAHSLDMFEHPLCKVLIHIDHDGDYYLKYHKERVAWHPCCMPNDLFPAKKPNRKNKLLYAGRITPWKNAHLVTGISAFWDVSIYGRVDNEDYANANGIVSHQFYKDEIEYGNYDLFWSVNGTADNKMIVKRLDLSAFEAISNGLMPIVNSQGIPKEISNLFISVDPLNFNKQKLVFDVHYYRTHKFQMWDRMYEGLGSSYASFNSVKKSIRIILEKLGAI